MLPALAGCIRHRVELTGPDDRTVQCAVDRRLTELAPGQVWSAEHTLPVEVAATAWFRRPDGTLLRADEVVSTPRPWWQWIPFDLATDLLWPGTILVPAAARLEPVEVPSQPGGDMAAQAERCGYGHRPSATPDPVQEE